MTDTHGSVLLADLTTVRVGGPARHYVAATTQAELIDAIRSADDADIPVLVIGGGSNLVIDDAGFDGLVVQDQRREVTFGDISACTGAHVTVSGGYSWDHLVARAVAEQWSGFEAMSGIPGTVGAAPVQNIGAYGAQVSDVLAGVRVWDRLSATIRTIPVSNLRLGYRTSLLKETMQQLADGPWYPTPRYVVLDVTFQSPLGSLGQPTRYEELARTLEVSLGERVDSTRVREAVLELRSSKAMVLDDPTAPDYDRWSAGSFFTNPMISVPEAAALPPEAPRYDVAASTGGVSRVKTSAAWLIQNAGFAPGFGVDGPESAARLSTRHSLAITNRGSASCADIVELARTVRHGVHQKFGVTLVPEPVLVGVSL